MELELEKFFNTENINLVADELQEYLPSLFAEDIWIENTKEIMKVFDYIYSLKDKEIMQYFIKYSNLKYEDSILQSCLAYYLGMKKGLNFKNSIK